MSLKNGFGFISYPDNNLFFYHGDVEGVDFKTLRIGDEVTFTLAKNDKGENIAKRVTLSIYAVGEDEDDDDDDDDADDLVDLDGDDDEDDDVDEFAN